MKRLRLIIADDHPVVRAGLEAILGTEPDFELVGSAQDCAAATKLILEAQPDVALIDLRMPGGSGVTVLEHIRHACIGTRGLILTTYDVEAEVLAALDAGASGYVMKDLPREQLFHAIREVARGRRVISPRLEQRLRQRSAKARDSLTERELDVLRWLARGEANQSIASRLHISEATVKTHLIHIFAKLGVSQRTAAVAEALRRGWVSLDAPS